VREKCAIARKRENLTPRLESFDDGNYGGVLFFTLFNAPEDSNIVVSRVADRFCHPLQRDDLITGAIKFHAIINNKLRCISAR